VWEDNALSLMRKPQGEEQSRSDRDNSKVGFVFYGAEDENVRDRCNCHVGMFFLSVSSYESVGRAKREAVRGIR
jgi:hypothetical protein